MMSLRITLAAAILFCASEAGAQELEGPPSPPATPAATGRVGVSNGQLTPEEVKGYQPDFAKKAAKFLGTFAYRAVQRSRRGIVLGPYVGAAGIKFLGRGDYDFQGTVGLGLLKFKVPILPDTGATTDIVVSAAKKAFWNEIKMQLLEGRSYTRDELDELAEKVWRDVLDELQMKRFDHSLKKPSFAIRAKATYTSSADAWETSMTGSVGVSRFLITTGTTFVVAPLFRFFVPAEISYPFAFGSGLRTNVGEIYARYDISLYDRDTKPDRVTVGARLTLDIL